MRRTDHRVFSRAIVCGATTGATNLMLVTFLIPVSALFLGITILGERLEPRHLGGMALIGLGLAASARRDSGG